MVTVVQLTIRGFLENTEQEPSMNTDKNAQLAADYANKAAEVASKLKPGTWDSVQSLALLSIAHSLVAQDAAGKPAP